MNESNWQEAEATLKEAETLVPGAAQGVRLRETLKGLKLCGVYREAKTLLDKKAIDEAMERVCRAEDEGLGRIQCDELDQIQKAFLKLKKTQITTALEAENFNGASKLQKQILRQDPQLAEEQKQKISRHRKIHEHKITNRRETEIKGNLESAHACFDAQKFDQAAIFFKHVLEIDPDHSIARGFLTSCSEKLDRVEQAFARSQSLVAEDRLAAAAQLLENYQAWHEDSRKLFNDLKKREAAARKQLENGGKLANKDQWPAALAQFEEALQVYPDLEEAEGAAAEARKRIKAQELHDLGLQNARQGQHEDAIRRLQESLDLVDDEKVRKSLTRIEQEQGKQLLAEAKKLLARGEYAKAEQEAREGMQTARDKSAFKQVLAEINDQKDDANELFFAAEAAYKSLRTDEAVAQLQDLLENRPGFTEARKLLDRAQDRLEAEDKLEQAKSLKQAGQLQKALQLLKPLQSRFPELSEITALLQELEKEFTISGKLKLLVYDSNEDFLIIPNKDITIGSGDDNDVQLQGISLRHARIMRDDTRFLLLNASRSHPPQVNGQTTEQKQLADGDLISFGASTALRVTIADGDGSSRANAILKVERGQPEDLTFVLMGEVIRFGKGSECEVRLYGLTATPHACLRLRHDHYMLEPLQPTDLDDNRCRKPAALRNGSVIKMASVQIEARSV